MSTAIGFELPAEVLAARDGILEFARAEILPRHEKHKQLFEDPRRYYHESGRLSDDVLKIISEIRTTAAKAGYYQMCVPEELGGGGMGYLAYYACWEALFHLCGPLNSTCIYALAHWCFGPSRMFSRVSDRAKREFLPSLMDGTKSMCFGLSEPGAGSDASMISTRAKPDGEAWIINGRKIWTTNSPIADFCVVFAATDPSARNQGITAFLVPFSTPGFHFQRVVKMFGHIGGDEGELYFEDMRVEPWQVIGEVGKGFEAALTGISLGRVYNTARAVGTARWALERAFEYTQTRKAFGQKISDFQGVTFPLAQAATEVHGAQLMGINATMLLDQGKPAIKELSMAKAYAVQVGVAAVDRAIQAHGAMGFTNELGLVDAWAKLRTINVADGTNEILYRTVVQRMLKGDVDL